MKAPGGFFVVSTFRVFVMDFAEWDLLLAPRVRAVYLLVLFGFVVSQAGEPYVWEFKKKMAAVSLLKSH